MHDTTAFAPDDIAEFLQQNPRFFDTHAQIFANLSVPHPYEGRAISLGERQILTLRERTHVLERQLATLTHNAKDNQRIMAAVHEWSLQLLAEADASALPSHITRGLADRFNVPDSALRLWHTNESALSWAQAVSDEVTIFAESLTKPYCGPNTGFEAAQWLATPPQSLALLPLRTPAQGRTFGLLVLGSDDPNRYTTDMATDFLQQIADLAGAALSRLLSATVAG